MTELIKKLEWDIKDLETPDRYISMDRSVQEFIVQERLRDKKALRVALEYMWAFEREAYCKKAIEEIEEIMGVGDE